MTAASPPIWHILSMGTLAGLATTAGTLLVLFLGKPRENILALLLAAAGGVMLAVVTVDLLPTALKLGPLRQVLSGLVAGVVLMALAVNFLGKKNKITGSRRNRLKATGILIAMGIALHDVPEGMAISVGHEAASQLGGLIALAITLHNLPEGMAIAAPLRMAGIRRFKIILLSLGIAVFTPFGSLLGLIALRFVSGTLTFFLALAAGAMGLLVFQELLPASRERHPNWSRLGTIIGFVAFAVFSLSM